MSPPEISPVGASRDSGDVHLEPDSGASVAESSDSGFDSDHASTGSTSIASSIVGYKYENGRRYHAYREGSYYLPNDEAEQARLDLLHHIHTLALSGALYVAPLNGNIRRCLDFGTGTGIWAIDFSDMFPNAEVVGTDLSPIQPTWIPPNLKFFVDDVEAEWSYRPDEMFDLVHGRGMGGAIRDWEALLRQIYDNLNPGGYVEMQEYESWFYSYSDPDLTLCPNIKLWADLVNEGSSKFGKDVNVAPKLKQLMLDIGFEDVQEKIVKIPIGPWAKGTKAKDLGFYQRENMVDCVESFTPALFTRVLGWSNEECQVLMARTKSEFRDPRNQLWDRFFYVYGRRPDS